MESNKKSKSGKSESEEIWVNEFTEESAQDFRDRVLEIAKEDKNIPIVIYIDSYGGLIDSLAKMVETIDEVQNPVVTVCMGKAMSAGAILLSCGDVRWCGVHSRIMIHEVSGGTVGDVHDMHSDAAETKRLNKYFIGLLAKNCKIKGGYDGLRKLIKARDGRDIYLDAQSALKFGIVDAVGVPKLNGITLYELSTTPAKRIKVGDGFKQAK